MTQLVDQTTSRTNRKVKFASWTATWVAPAAALVTGLLLKYLPPDLRQFDTELALLVLAAITGAGTWIAGYYTRARGDEA